MQQRLAGLLPAIGLILILGGVQAGCEDDRGRGLPPGGGPGSDGPVGATTDGSRDGAGDGAVGFDARTGEAGGTLTITITAPTASTVLAGASFDVTAQVVTTVVPVDTASIVAQIAGLTPVRMLPTGMADTYRASLPLGSLESGAYSVTVTAATLDGGTAQAALPVLVNAGPLITILRPSLNEPASRTLSYDFLVRISPALLGVTSVQVGTVTANMGLCAVTLGSPVGTPTAREWIGTVDLTTCSPPPAEGPLQFTVVAQDTTMPTGIRSTKSTTFVIDRTGPTITVNSPTAGQLVGGIITVAATVADPSGINPLTVYATISHGSTGFTFPLLQQSGSSFANTFDTRTLPNPTLIQFPAIEVVADDTLGNHSRTGGILFTLDNVPPVGDLNPAQAQIVDCTGGPCKCARPFDPVGSECPNDLQTVSNITQLRAEIVDRGNGFDGYVTFISLVTRATLYVLRDNSRPLIVDSNANGICDAPNPQIIPATGMLPGPTQALALEMVKIPVSGTPDYSASPSYPLFVGYCSPGSEAMPPRNLCVTTNLTVFLGLYWTNPIEPVIWTLPPTPAPPALICGGLPLDALANNLDDGWLCVAVAFEDGVGNRSVSPPMRLCLDKYRTGIPCASPGPAPNCTGTLNPTTGVVTTSPTCTSNGFPTNQVFLRQ